MTKRQAQHATSEQLSLLADSDLPVQFRLDRRTRERGLAHIAAIRRQLAGNATGAPMATDEFADHHQHRAA